MKEESGRLEGEQFEKWHWWWITLSHDNRYITQSVRTSKKCFDTTCVDFLKHKHNIPDGKFIIMNLTYAGEATIKDFNDEDS